MLRNMRYICCMEKKCTICGKKYNAKQERSMYCSNACKQHAHRNKVTKTVTVTQNENKELRNTVSVLEQCVMLAKKADDCLQAYYKLAKGMADPTGIKSLPLWKKYVKAKKILDDYKDSNGIE